MEPVPIRAAEYYGVGDGELDRGNSMRVIHSIRLFVIVLALLAFSAVAFAQIGIAITIAPPELPVYEQPLCPGDGYLWTPGYWGYADADYYWVPGTWVMAPQPGLLWTPAYWGWGGNAYVFNEGYWGPHVGFYGGVSYGYGYFGEGYQGGRWENEHFYYNQSVSNVNVTVIHNTYNTTVIHNNNESRVSYNGGKGGIERKPTAQEVAVVHEKHVAPVAAQTEHAQAARKDPELKASVNHGKPAVAATAKPVAANEKVVAPAKAEAKPEVKAEGKPETKPEVKSTNAPAEHAGNPQVAKPPVVEHAAKPPVPRPPTAEPQQHAPAEHASAPVESKRPVAEPQRAPAEHTAAPMEPKHAAEVKPAPAPKKAETKKAAPAEPKHEEQPK